MRNANMPANPLSDARLGARTAQELPVGLSKREYYAGLALQGVLSNSTSSGESVARMAAASIAAADTLLAALDDNTNKE